jgi:hypothetical protein
MGAARRLADDGDTLDVVNGRGGVVGSNDGRRTRIDERGQARVIGAIPGAIISVPNGEQAIIEGIALWG